MEQLIQSVLGALLVVTSAATTALLAYLWRTA